MNRIKVLLLTILLTGLLQVTHAQKEIQNENKLHQRVSIIISHTHIPAANEVNGDKRLFIAASLGLNYELWFNQHWAVGLHNDITMQSFNVEKKSGNAVIKREFPFLSTFVVIYKPTRHWNYFAGPGREFENHENFNVIKTGIEYGIELPKTWEIGFGIEYDAKLNGYDSWLVGIGISKIF